MNRFFAEPIDGVAVLSAEDSHHLRRVLRAEIGDLVEIAHDGAAFFGEVVELSPFCVVKIGEEASAGESGAQIHLYQAFAKGDKMDFIVQKAVELGVTSISPVFTRYTDVKLAGTRLDKKIAHLQGVAEAAAKQCKRSRISVIESPLQLKEAIARAAGTEILFCYEKAAPGMGTFETGRAFSVFIGPEGGFSEEEAALFADAQARPISLGPRILRTETAGILMLSILQYEIGDLMCNKNHIK